MKAHPIIFNDEMVRAILADKKTQTRRVVKPALWPILDESNYVNGWPSLDMLDFEIPCPFGRVGSELWVKETWAYCDEIEHYNQLLGEDRRALYRATDPDYWVRRWRPSRFMPRCASRITLEITGIRVEKLQAITANDINAEGYPYQMDQGGPVGLLWYMGLWDSINAKRGYGWDTNCWCWVLEFRKMEGEWP